MTEPEVKSLLFREFLAWMRGQTVGVGPGGTTNYYDHDVEKFCAMVRLQIVNKYLGITD